MTKSLFSLALGLLLLFCAIPAMADQYDDCVSGCEQNLKQCVEQVRLTAGNVQEEKDMIAACEGSKANCRQVCTDAETQPQPPQQQEQSSDQPQEQPQEQPQNQ